MFVLMLATIVSASVNYVWASIGANANIGVNSHGGANDGVVLVLMLTSVGCWC
jgi:hypothetical protein